ncbi:MAG: hypothetical protein L0I24_09920 [Pseudonocardia sp.]|nr:hypothetical protein [Pseudonocardia sp.]
MEQQRDVPQVTPRLEAILKQATADAIGRGQSYVGVEHVMVAIIAEGGSASVQLLRDHSDMSSLTAAIEAVLAEGTLRSKSP